MKELIEATGITVFMAGWFFVIGFVEGRMSYGYRSEEKIKRDLRGN